MVGVDLINELSIYTKLSNLAQNICTYIKKLWKLRFEHVYILFSGCECGVLPTVDGRIICPHGVNCTADPGTVINCTADLGTVVYCTADHGTVINCTVDPGTAVKCKADQGTVVNCTADPGTVVNCSADLGTLLTVQQT